jgi:hypothetical protein
MKTKWLAIGIILLFVGVTIAPTINFQVVKASQQNIIKERINQRELLFQTIVDIANNKEIQRIILKSQMSRGIFPTSEIPVVTKNQLKQMYFIGLILSKVVSKSRIQSMVQQNQFNNQKIQQEITTIIEKDTTLNTEITQLKDIDCDCENENTAAWRFPIICNITYVLFLISFAIFIGFSNSYFPDFTGLPEFIIKFIGFLYLIFGISALISFPMTFFYWTIGALFTCPWAVY